MLLPMSETLRHEADLISLRLCILMALLWRIAAGKQCLKSTYLKRERKVTLFASVSAAAVSVSAPPPPPLTKLLELSTIANFTFDLFSPWSVSPESLQVQVFDSCHVANFRPSETVFHLPVVSSLDSLGKRISGFSMFRENYSQTLCRLLFLSVSHARVQRSPRSPLLSTYALSIRFGALCKSF